MLESVPREYNLNNLRDVFARIGHLNAFVFFGTLLGYTREGNIIAHDDDIDIYVDKRQKWRLWWALRRSGFEIVFHPKKRRPWRSKLFQARREQGGVMTYADFYFYDTERANHISEPWNFVGTWRLPETALHTPKDLIFPLQKAEMQGIEINIPAQPEAICEFLYGPGWKTPLRKEAQYRIEVRNHKPTFIPINAS